MARNRRVELSTIIGAGSEITGDLVLDGGVRIDGTIRGSIISTGIVAIGVTGVAEADITAQECHVAGRVTGKIVVQEGIELDKSAQVFGDIFAKIIKIHSGAVFQGSSSMSNTKDEEDDVVESASTTEV
jgi:cytoskeletal protein CcmA (bactofilin family)